MAIYDVLSRKLSEKSQEAYKYGKNVADTVKYNSLIADEEKYINSIYADIGEAYVTLYAGNYHEQLLEKIDLLSRAFQRIEEYQSQLNSASGVIVCQNCGNKTDSNASFCSVCGSKIIKKTAEPTRICPNCHAPVRHQDDFCMECGQMLNSSEQSHLKKCPSCNAIVKEGMAFCMECGQDLKALNNSSNLYTPEDTSTDYPENNNIEEQVHSQSYEEQNDYYILDDEIPPEPEPEIIQKLEDKALSDVPRFCTECGTRLEAGEKFCIKCGTKFEL